MWDGTSKKGEALELSQAAKAIFMELKEIVLPAPVLAFADFKRPFCLEMDASGQGFGAVLSQHQEDGCFHLVTFASHSLSKAEKNYHGSKLEFLALKWAMTEHFKDYLAFKPFEVHTDNNPLTYINTTPNLDATGHRWVGALVSFNFPLH